MKRCSDTDEKYASAYQQNLELKQEDQRLKESNQSQEEIIKGQDKELTDYRVKIRQGEDTIKILNDEIKQEKR